MSGYRHGPRANVDIDEIYDFSYDRWGRAQADLYVHALYAAFAEIVARRRPWLRIDPAFGVDGYFVRHQQHRIYFKPLADGDIGIVAVLRQLMHAIVRLKGAFGDTA
jgi:plasmid stabilization system protein ParE